MSHPRTLAAFSVPFVTVIVVGIGIIMNQNTPSILSSSSDRVKELVELADIRLTEEWGELTVINGKIQASDHRNSTIIQKLEKDGRWGVFVSYSPSESETLITKLAISSKMEITQATLIEDKLYAQILLLKEDKEEEVLIRLQHQEQLE